MGCGRSSIVKVGGQPHLLSGNVALGIPVRIHKRIMGVLTRNNGNDKRSSFVVLVATSISATWQVVVDCVGACRGHHKWLGMDFGGASET